MGLAEALWPILTKRDLPQELRREPVGFNTGPWWMGVDSQGKPDVFYHLSPNSGVGYNNGTYYMDNNDSGVSYTPLLKLLEYFNGNYSISHSPGGFGVGYNVPLKSSNDLISVMLSPKSKRTTMSYQTKF